MIKRARGNEGGGNYTIEATDERKETLKTRNTKMTATKHTKKKRGMHVRTE